MNLLSKYILFLAFSLTFIAHAEVPGLDLCIDSNGPYDCPADGGHGGGSGGRGGGDIDVTYDDGFGRPPPNFGRATCVDTGKHDDCQTFDEQWKNSDLGKGFRQLDRSLKDGWDVIRGEGSRKKREQRKFQRQIREVANLYDRVQHLEGRIKALDDETYRDVRALALASYPTREQIRERLNDIAREYNSSLSSATAELPSIDGQLTQNPSLNPESVYTKVGRQYSSYAKRVIAKQDGPRRQEQEALTLFADASFDSADGYYSSGQLSQGDASVSLGLAAVDTALSMTPGVGWGRDIYEAVSGRNLITGDSLDTTDRVFAVIGAVTGGIGSKAKIGYKGVMAGIKALDKIHDAGKAADGLHGATTIAGKALTSGKKVVEDLGPKKFGEIMKTPKGSRPNPDTYLSKKYIEEHVGKFADGASKFIRKQQLEKYGPAQRDGTAFVLPKNEADDLIASADGDRRKLERALGFEEGFLDHETLVRIDVPKPKEMNLRIPSGNEAGVSPLWIPGGKLPDGNHEAVIDLGSAPTSKWKTSPLEF